MANDGLAPLPGEEALGVPKSRKSWSCLGIFLVAPAVIIGVVLLVVAIGTLFVLTGREKPITERDRSVVLDIHDLSKWMEGYTPNTQAESIKKTRYLDGSYDVEYKYDVPDDPEAPYLVCTVTVETDAETAKIGSAAMWSASKVAFSVRSDVEGTVQERNDLFRWGDHSRFGIVKVEEKPFGNIFVARQGKYMFYVIWNGIYFADTESINGLLLTKLERLRWYKP